MATEPPNNEAIAMAEMKIEMTLDEIIKLSKKDEANRKTARRSFNKSRRNVKHSAYQPNFSMAQNFLESRSTIRQGVLAKRRTNFQKNQFQAIADDARKAVSAPPPRNRGAGNWKKIRKPFFQVKAAEGDANASGKNMLVLKHRQTLDSRFAVMAVQRKKALPPQMFPFGGGWRRPGEQLQQPRQGRTNSGFPVGSVRTPGNFRK